MDYHKYNSNKRSYYGIRNVSDRLCYENGLSVITPEKGRKGKSYIKFGEKSSKVEIDFIANDGREYNLKTEFFKTKPKKQTLKDMTGSEYDGDIQEKLEELCGIKKGFEETYENIVIAKQNEFINIFKAKPKDREEIFKYFFILFSSSLIFLIKLFNSISVVS